MEILDRIKRKIREVSNITDYSERIGLSQPHLSDILNGKKPNITFETLLKVIEPIGMNILEDLPSKLVQRDCVYLNGKTLKMGSSYKSKMVIYCFGTGESSHQGMILKTKKGEVELMVF